MKTKLVSAAVFAAILFLIHISPCVAGQDASSPAEKTPEISIPKDMGEVMIREVAMVKGEMEAHARSLFRWEPVGWNAETIEYLYKSVFVLPGTLAGFTRVAMDQGRILGVVGSLLVLLFISAVLYGFLGRNWVLAKVEKISEPLAGRLPEDYAPYFRSGVQISVSALMPLILLGLFQTINAMITYRAAWFQLTGRFLGLWLAGNLTLGFLKEALTRDLFKVTAKFGKPICRWAKLVVLYVLSVILVFWAVEAFRIRPDVVALFRFVVNISIVAVLFLFFMKKSALLSLFPTVTSRSYLAFFNFFGKYYYPLLSVSFLAALLWCVGYRALGRLLLTKIWFSLGGFLAILLVYHMLDRWLQKWAAGLKESDETGRFLLGYLKTMLLYATVLASVVVVLNLLGLLTPLQRVMSFPIFSIGETTFTFWIVLKAFLILLGFLYASRLVQGYLDYKIYPALGVEPGPGYAINTFIRYVSLAAGLIIALNIVGIDLRFFLVFAGAIGIGVGLGLQSMAANVISGLAIIFGGKIRRGDWIQVGDTMGMVRDIFLRATMVRTRDNIEYLIPNSDLISGTTVNYSLSSPLIRIELPVGVSYEADPREVERILLDVAEKEPLVSTNENPVVRFIAYGDSSIDFELLIWIDVRKVPRRKVRSALYFTIFDEFSKAGIEIPFPQRDVHIRNEVPGEGLREQ